ncbi:MAG TPA: hypothetical protein GXZ60_09000 [Intrasporangiaceae bacterium]|nr:hypothetical protein [Intrasporangiaceae bacterium]
MGSRIRLLGALSAAIAFVITLTVPLFASSDGTTTGAERVTLIAASGWGAAVPGLILTVLAAVVWLARYVMIRWIALAVFLILTALMLASLGLFFLPAALLLMLGVSLDRGTEDAAA